MAKYNISCDTSDFDNMIGRIARQVTPMVERCVQEMADTILKEARDQVPLDEGTLSKSGNAYVEGDTGIVAFNTAYAAYQHEGIRADGTHRIRNYQGGRKGKYLEDPVKMSLSRLEAIAQKHLASSLT